MKPNIVWRIQLHTHYDTVTHGYVHESVRERCGKKYKILFFFSMANFGQLK
jgi:hypothetical protein